MLASFEQPNLMFTGRASPFKRQGVKIMDTNKENVDLLGGVC
jgi:hypothetical protein